ncbi:MAG: hypothetical protein MOGMAGMI_01827 [Candidatus Omnitrophica bacterium]|nr:hypothetical protein [Candidatus Omnitrophota bacterium]
MKETLPTISEKTVIRCKDCGSIQLELHQVENDIWVVCYICRSAIKRIVNFRSLN